MRRGPGRGWCSIHAARSLVLLLLLLLLLAPRSAVLRVLLSNRAYQRTGFRAGPHAPISLVRYGTSFFWVGGHWTTGCYWSIAVTHARVHWGSEIWWRCYLSQRFYRRFAVSARDRRLSNFAPIGNGSRSLASAFVFVIDCGDCESPRFFETLFRYVWCVGFYLVIRLITCLSFL